MIKKVISTGIFLFLLACTESKNHTNAASVLRENRLRNDVDTVIDLAHGVHDSKNSIITFNTKIINIDPKTAQVSGYKNETNFKATICFNRRFISDDNKKYLKCDFYRHIKPNDSTHYGAQIFKTPPQTLSLDAVIFTFNDSDNIHYAQFLEFNIPEKAIAKQSRTHYLGDFIIGYMEKEVGLPEARIQVMDAYQKMLPQPEDNKFMRNLKSNASKNLENNSLTNIKFTSQAKKTNVASKKPLFFEDKGFYYDNL